MTKPHPQASPIAREPILLLGPESRFHDLLARELAGLPAEVLRADDFGNAGACVGRGRRAPSIVLLPERQIRIDCDVIQADGGTRTASVTGALVAFWEACHLMYSAGALERWPIREKVAAVSVGIVEGFPLLDLCYSEDSLASVDMNVIMTEGGEFAEIQGTGEESTFKRSELEELLVLGEKGVRELIQWQTQALDGLSVA